MTEAWVTLTTNDGYAQGALVLGHSLRAVSTTKVLHCMSTRQVGFYIIILYIALFRSLQQSAHH